MTIVNFVQKYGNYQSIEKLYKNFDVADFTVEERFRLIEILLHA